MKNKQNLLNPTVKDALLLIGAGVFISSSIIIPGLPLALKPFIQYKREKDYKEWKKFNLPRLKQVLKRLANQKAIDIKGDTVVITEHGKRKLLKFNLENLKLEGKWDGRWRLIIYDIPKEKKKQSDYFRQLLKRIRCFQLQKSVYLTPFHCEDEIEYIKQLFTIGDNVQVLKIASIENESVYKDYFGI